jgi:hypothetical protein
MGPAPAPPGCRSGAASPPRDAAPPDHTRRRGLLAQHAPAPRWTAPPGEARVSGGRRTCVERRRTIWAGHRPERGSCSHRDTARDGTRGRRAGPTRLPRLAGRRGGRAVVAPRPGGQVVAGAPLPRRGEGRRQPLGTAQMVSPDSHHLPEVSGPCRTASRVTALACWCWDGSSASAGWEKGTWTLPWHGCGPSAADASSPCRPFERNARHEKRSPQGRAAAECRYRSRAIECDLCASSASG